MRLVGIDHGFPYIYHPDEPAVIRSALGIRFDPNPHHFDWPHLYFYLNYLSYMVFAKVRDLASVAGLKPWLSQALPILWNDNVIFYFVTRALSAILGAVSVIPIYLWLKKLVSKNSGLISAAILALAPFHVRDSHYALLDVPMLFFLSWALYFSTTSPALAGLFLGFATSTKYNGILVAVFIVACLIKNRRKLTDYLKVGLFTIVGFILGTPYAVLDFKTFIRTDGPQGALWQFTNVGRVGFVQHLQQFADTLTQKLPDDLGYGVYIVFLFGFVTILGKLIRKRSVEFNLLASALFFLLLVFYISGQERHPSHYYLIAYPFFIMVAGWATETLLVKVRKKYAKALLALLIITPSFVLAVLNISDLINKRSNRIYGGDKIVVNETTK